MLNLNRKEGQSIIIGEGSQQIRVVIKRVVPLLSGGHDVELGFEAPRYIAIDREEVRKRRIENVDKVFDGNRK